MATTTYTPIETYTVTSAQSSFTFNSIPQTYTDLIIIFNGTLSTADNNYIEFNNENVNQLYSVTRLYGNGSTNASNRSTSQNSMQLGEMATVQSTDIIQIQNYANTNINKTVISRGSNTTGNVKITAGLFRSNLAITTIKIMTGGANYQAGSTFTLYGISNAGDDSPKANGGDVYSDSSYWYHVFTMSGNFVPNQSLTADILCIAGGGSGGREYGGGGGAGGYKLLTSQSLTAQSYSVVIGGGGAAPTAKSLGNNGGDSSFTGSGFTTITSTGGGGGGSNDPDLTGRSGGSGGGGGVPNAGTTSGGAASPSGQGNAGGGGGRLGAGGGGGAGAVGATFSGNNGGNGGIGLNTASTWATATTTGVSGYYAAGGGGVGWTTGGTGGTGGAGDGSSGPNTIMATSALPNTGSGGGGGATTTGAGGSGIVIVRYAK